MRLVKIPAMTLKPGMFVAELDRPWLKTPFALQGFVIRDTEEILYVSDYVDHVYVDAEYKGRRQNLELAMKPTAIRPKKRLRLRDEFERSKLSFASATETLDKVFDSLRKGQSQDINAVKEAINPLIEGVFRNQEAVAALVRLKQCGDYRYHHGVSMAVWGAILGRHIGLHRDELEKLAVGCAMCDVGMTQLPPELLDQAENLSDKQRQIIRAHPIMGADLASKSKNRHLRRHDYTAALRQCPHLARGHAGTAGLQRHDVPGIAGGAVCTGNRPVPHRHAGGTQHRRSG